MFQVKVSFIESEGEELLVKLLDFLFLLGNVLQQRLEIWVTTGERSLIHIEYLLNNLI